ncbi:MAG TPA: glycerophosphodiester phosphodiesterase family protein, partial [Candidatus Polarisedimenticolaceae bacterium]|nr:glycerophosphodiester phosphodiesterase family protein [Candidatus Polarisedimenticolaceae bacterium]
MRRAPPHPFFEVPHPIVLGHRGAAGEAPENTLAGFARALELGATVIEADVRLTADAVPVMIHDSTIDRTTNGRGTVAAMTFDGLQRLDAGFSFSADGGASYPFRGCGVRVPSLAQALAEFA